MNTILRKLAQEVEIDHLLSEEFACDPGFLPRFLAACDIPAPTAEVIDVVPEPVLGGLGYGDLLVLYKTSDDTSRPSSILIENKINSAPGNRQAARYQEYANIQTASNWHYCRIILVAPQNYIGERSEFDAFISYESIMRIMENASESRLLYRRAILQRAIIKQSTSGVGIPDQDMLQLRRDYHSFFDIRGIYYANKFNIERLKGAYAAGESWNYFYIPGIEDAYIRHRLWTTIADKVGKIDFIIRRPIEEVTLLISGNPYPSSTLETYGNYETKICVDVPEMRQKDGFNQAVAEIVFSHIDRMISWYKEMIINTPVRLE
ncbi:hypothetical protein [Segnochrobactrum spirostomi]|uniref:PD-(D/E)XK nuclease superfamily protein n=1 Tax=Segnochrobactrum spirostomi TaxID=2608987 RepID=A0A6A7XYJ0_9HYPH|nr:hypothetical protein [Segnochrobactrum spirostomi]MQT11483.1 hypothetical protein [Segnochrobactrum spirostomi]